MNWINNGLLLKVKVWTEHIVSSSFVFKVIWPDFDLFLHIMLRDVSDALINHELLHYKKLAIWMLETKFIDMSHDSLSDLHIKISRKVLNGFNIRVPRHNILHKCPLVIVLFYRICNQFASNL